MKAHIVLRTSSRCSMDTKPKVHKVFYTRREANKEAQVRNASSYSRGRKLTYWVVSKEIDNG